MHTRNNDSMKKGIKKIKHSVIDEQMRNSKKKSKEYKKIKKKKKISRRKIKTRKTKSVERQKR